MNKKPHTNEGLNFESVTKFLTTLSNICFSISLIFIPSLYYKIHFINTFMQSCI